MALTLTQNQQDCVGRAVEILDPQNSKNRAKIEEMVKVYISLCETTFFREILRSPRKARDQLRKLDKIITDYIELIDKLDPIADVALGADAKTLDQARETLASVAPRLSAAIQSVPRPRGGADPDWPKRMLALKSLQLFEAYREGEARLTTGDFPEFVQCMYQAADDDDDDDDDDGEEEEKEPSEMQRIVRWALREYRQTGGWLQP